MVLPQRDFGHVPYGAAFAKWEWHSLPMRFFCVCVDSIQLFMDFFFFLFKIESFCIAQAGFVV